MALQVGGGSVGGSGTPGTLPVWSTPTTLGNSLLSQPSAFTVQLTAGTLTAGQNTGHYAVSTLPDFWQYDIRNMSSGSGAQSGYSATADTGTSTTGFCFQGINNSGTAVVAPYNIGGPLDCNLMGSGNDLYIANTNNSKDIIFSLGKAASPYFDEFGRFSRSALNFNLSVAELIDTGKASGTLAAASRTSLIRLGAPDGSLVGIEQTAYGPNPEFIQRFAGGTRAAPTAPVSGNGTILNYVYYWDGTSAFFRSAQIRNRAGATHSTTEAGNDWRFGCIAVGDTSRTIVESTIINASGLISNLIGAGSFVPTAGNGLLQLATGTTKANGIAFGTDTFLYRTAANTLNTDGSFISAQSTISQVAATSGTPASELIVTGAAHTGLTLAEVIDSDFNMARTVTFGASGTLGTQRGVLFRAPTYASSVATATLTNAATLAVTGAPVAGANTTLTNTYAFWVQAGTAALDGGLVSRSQTTVSGIQNNNGQGLFRIAPGTAATSGTPVLVNWTPPANTGQTASTEVIRANFNFSATQTWAAGSFATQREFLVQAPTYAFATTPSTITKAATFAITNAPQAGTNATITNPYALWVQAGAAQFDGLIGGSAGLTVTAGAVTLPTNSVNDASLSANVAFLNAPNTFAGTQRNSSTLGHLQISPTAMAGGIGITFKVTPAANTNQTLGTEIPGIMFDVNANSREWAAGSFSIQREVIITQPIYKFVSASTITTAATFAIQQAPAAGVNATITNAYALWIQGGTSRFGGSLIIDDASNISVGTTFGTTIATTTSQKLGFWGATPVVQQNTTGTATGFTAGVGTAVNDVSTFTGGTGATAYRISDVILALKRVGLLAA